MCVITSRPLGFDEVVFHDAPSHPVWWSPIPKSENKIQTCHINCWHRFIMSCPPAGGNLISIWLLWGCPCCFNQFVARCSQHRSDLINSLLKRQRLWQVVLQLAAISTLVAEVAILLTLYLKNRHHCCYLQIIHTYSRNKSTYSRALSSQ